MFLEVEQAQTEDPGGEGEDGEVVGGGEEGGPATPTSHQAGDDGPDEGRDPVSEAGGEAGQPSSEGSQCEVGTEEKQNQEPLLAHSVTEELRQHEGEVVLVDGGELHQLRPSRHLLPPPGALKSLSQAGEVRGEVRGEVTGAPGISDSRRGGYNYWNYGGDLTQSNNPLPRYRASLPAPARQQPAAGL